MDTLIRNTTLRFSRRVEGCYEYLDNSKTDEKNKKQMVISRSKNNHNQGLFPNGHHQMVFRFSYRRERARQRQIFLQTYKLTSMDDGGGNNSSRKSSRPKKLKRAVIKLKSAVISVLSFLRADHTMGSTFSCTSKSAISVTSPTRIVKCC